MRSWMFLTCLCLLTGRFGVALGWPANVPGVADLRQSKEPGSELKKALEAKQTTIVLLPAGTFDVAGPLEVGVMLVGQGADKTLLRIVPGRTRRAAAEAPPYGIILRDGAALRDLSVEIADASPDIVGVVMEDSAWMRNVTLRTKAAVGAGVRASAATGNPEHAPDDRRIWLDHVAIEGFDKGMVVEGQACLVTAEHLGLHGQTTVGVVVDGACAALLNLDCQDAPLAIDIKPGGVVALDTAVLTAKGAAGTAIRNAGGVSLRAVRLHGYGQAVKDCPPGAETQWSSFPARGGGQPVPIQPPDAPEPFDPPADQWVNGCTDDPVTQDCYSWGRITAVKNWSPAIQKAVHAGAKAIYIPPNQAHALLGNLLCEGQVRVLDGMRGNLHQIFHGSGDEYTGTITVGDGDGPMEIRDLRMDLANITIRHVGKRTLVLRNVSGFRYVAQKGAGDLHLVNASPISMTLAAGQNVWGRSGCFLTHHEPAVTNHGATFWCLGMFANRWTTLVRADQGATTRILGGLAVGRSWRPKEPMFVVGDEARLDAVLGELPGSPIPYQTLLCDLSGKVLVGRGDAVKRSPDTPHRAGGSCVGLWR